MTTTDASRTTRMSEPLPACACSPGALRAPAALDPELEAALRSEVSGVTAPEVFSEAERVVGDAFVSDPATYTVRRGDTLNHIARDHGVTLEALLGANPDIRNPNRIHPGDSLVLPSSGRAPSSEVGTHTVVRGDTLGEIARGHGVSLPELLRLNPEIRDPNRISVGQAVRVPSSGPPPADDPAPPSPSVGTEGAVAPGLARGQRGPEVEGLQRRLDELGYRTGPADGIFGPQTQTAVRQFQLQAGLNTSGQVDEATAAAMNGAGAPRFDPAQHRAPRLAVYPPGSAEQVALFQEAARLIGVPEAWASDRGLVRLLQAESGGRVGIPNYTYGQRHRDPSQWSAVHDELRAGRITARSSATGLGQLLLSNVDRHYPSGRAGIGDPLEEAAGMLSYIRSRYGNPATAWARYGTVHEGY